jgi:DNA-binding transcriptional LysR family regulator
MVGLTHGDALQAHIEAHARNLNQILNVRVRLKTFESVCQLVGHKVGVAIIPERTARRFRRKFGFGVVRFSDLWATRQLMVCYKESEVFLPVMSSLLNYLEANSNLIFHETTS